MDEGNKKTLRLEVHLSGPIGGLPSGVPLSGSIESVGSVPVGSYPTKCVLHHLYIVIRVGSSRLDSGLGVLKGRLDF